MSATFRRLSRWGLGIAIAAAAAIQLVPVNRSNPPVVSKLKTSADVQEVLDRACYDCHSNETTWPWYSQVAPVSWWIADHVDEGRKHLNFSDWPTFDFAAQEHIFREIRQQVGEGNMPLKSYVRGHPEARLSDRDRETLLAWSEPGESF